MGAKTERRRLIALAVAAILFAAVFAISTQNSDADDAIGLLYVVPVAIVGLELGLEAGLLAAAGALGLVGVWVALRHPEVDAVGIITRAVAIFSVGALAGRFSDRMRAQAGLNTELEQARSRISEQFRSAHRLLDHHEGERGEVAQQLHEQVAQTVAAAMMALSLIQRDSGEGRLSHREIEALRLHMRDCLEDLRRIANTLRPAVLVELGLVPALERLCVENADRAGKPITLRAESRLEDLPTGIQTTAYRTVEEALRVLNAAAEVSTRRDEHHKMLTIAITSGSGKSRDPELEKKLAATRARLDLLGGTLHISQQPRGEVGVALVAEIPLRQD